jgi:hypothetical protein
MSPALVAAVFAKQLLRHHVAVTVALRDGTWHAQMYASSSPSKKPWPSSTWHGIPRPLVGRKPLLARVVTGRRRPRQRLQADRQAAGSRAVDSLESVIIVSGSIFPMERLFVWASWARLTIAKKKLGRIVCLGFL